MNLSSVYGQLNYTDRRYIISILNTYSSDYTKICRLYNNNAMPMIAFFNKKEVLKCLKSWQHDYKNDYPFGDRVMFDRVIKLIDIMT